MNYTFYTSNVNERLYKKAIWHFVYRTLGRKKYRQYREVLKNWDINIYPSTLSSQDPYFYGKRGVGGVTGQGVVKLYIEDFDQDMYFMQNFMMISHELCHMIGIILGWKEKIPLRNDDWGGNKKGTPLNKYVQEVHDRHVEGRLWTMRFWTWVKFWKKYSLRVLDIRDIV